MIWQPNKKIITSRHRQRGNFVISVATPGGDAFFPDVSLLMFCDEAADGADAIAPTIGPAFNNFEAGIGVAEISNNRQIFGSRSMFLDDTTGAAQARFITALHFAGTDFGAGDFTIEFHIFFAELNGTSRHIMSSWDDTGDLEWTIQIDAQNPGNFTTVFSTSQNGTATGFSIGQSWAAQHPTGGALNTWFHIAVTRFGDDWFLFTDGFELTTSNAAVTINTGTVPFRLGGAVTGGGPDSEISLANIRMTKGAARYTGDFAAPSARYPDFF